MCGIEPFGGGVDIIAALCDRQRDDADRGVTHLVYEGSVAFGDGNEVDH